MGDVLLGKLMKIIQVNMRVVILVGELNGVSLPEYNNKTV